jgi:ketosteroid isomerase-like protein
MVAGKTILSIGLVAGLAVGCGRPSPPSSETLMQADRDFAADVARGGSEAWASWFAADGSIIQPGVGELRGRESLRDFMSALDDPDVTLSWEPDRADIAASGDLGWTTGHYLSESRDADGVRSRATGLYVSIWRLQADGSWKVVMDLGNPLDPVRNLTAHPADDNPPVSRATNTGSR